MPLATRIQLFSSARMVTVVISYSTVTILVTDRGRFRSLKARREVLKLHFVG